MEQFPRPTASGASPTCWWMPARGTSSVDPLPRTSSRRRPPSAFHRGHREVPGTRHRAVRARARPVRAVELRRDGELVERVDEVFFDARRDAGTADRRRQLAAHSRAMPVRPPSLSSTDPQAASRPRGEVLILSWRSHPCLFDSKAPDLRPVLAEAVANQCRVVLVKDQGVLPGRAR